jgi:multidrug resistance efflux pump
MEKKDNVNNDLDQSVIVEVKPVDSPSENSLVTEHLRKMPSLFSRGLIYIIVLFLIVALVYSLVGKMDVVAECQAVAIPQSDLMRVQADRTGYIEQIYIAEGEEIEKDAPLFLIRTRDSVERQLEVNRLKLEQNKASLASIDSELSYWRKEVNRLSSDYKGILDLYQKGIVSKREESEAKSNLEKARTEEQKLIARKEILINENKILEQDSAQATEESEKIVRAEETGIISELFFKNPGEYIRESDLLCTIIPAGSPLYMDVIVANKDIGFIEEEMDIKYKFDAFPYMDYGVIKGKVSAIAPSAVEDKQLGFLYHIQGSLEIPFFDIKGKQYPIKVGMTATAEVITERNTIFTLLFKRFRGA